MDPGLQRDACLGHILLSLPVQELESFMDLLKHVISVGLVVLEGIVDDPCQIGQVLLKSNSKVRVHQNCCLHFLEGICDGHRNVIPLRWI